MGSRRRPQAKAGKTRHEADVVDFSFRCAPMNKPLLLEALQRCRAFSCEKAYHPLKSPLCWCVSITLPAASQTRITASCERLLCVAQPIALSGVSYHSRPNGST